MLCTKRQRLKLWALQIRKILELIAFSSLIANKRVYSKVYENFAKHWNAKTLLRDLERVNLHFYPTPIIPERSENITHLADKKSGFLNKKRFEFIYEKCGAILHAENPFGSVLDYAYYEKNILVWLNEIISLLNAHVVRLLNDDLIYVVHMKVEGSDRVHCFVMESIDNNTL